jgi:aminoglycoside phosphotransferase
MSLMGYVAPFARPWRGRREVARAAAVAPDIMRGLPRQERSAEGWALRSAHSTEAGLAVLMLGPPGQAPLAVLKVAHTREARQSLRREGTALAALEADDRLRRFHRLLPSILAEGEHADVAYLLERALPGRNAASLLGTAGVQRRLQAAAADAIRILHARTAVSTVARVATLDGWLSEPTRLVGRASLASRGTRGRHALIRVAAEIRKTLIGRRLRVSWVHGDFWLGNVLVVDDGAGVSGIVDWDFAGHHELPVLDVLHLLIYTRVLGQRKELGRVVRDLLEGEEWSPHELSLLRSGDAVFEREPDYARATLLLYWLRHLTSNLAQSSRYLHSHPWLGRNVEPVLRLFERPARGGF